MVHMRAINGALNGEYRRAPQAFQFGAARHGACRSGGRGMSGPPSTAQVQPCGCLWIGSTQYTASGCSAGVMSRFTTTASLSLRTSTHSSGSDVLALISWCGTYGGT